MIKGRKELVASLVDIRNCKKLCNTFLQSVRENGQVKVIYVVYYSSSSYHCGGSVPTWIIRFELTSDITNTII